VSVGKRTFFQFATSLVAGDMPSTIELLGRFTDLTGPEGSPEQTLPSEADRPVTDLVLAAR
jgi:hypothetical protein